VVAQRNGTEHHEHRVIFADLPEKIDHVVRSFGEPFSGVISTYFIMESISRHVKVALSARLGTQVNGLSPAYAQRLRHP
jgi:asparagine synthase (glutamine-hydrolysing)